MAAGKIRPLIKVTMLGDAGVGKSALTVKYINGVFMERFGKHTL